MHCFPVGKTGLFVRPDGGAVTRFRSDDAGFSPGLPKHHLLQENPQSFSTQPLVQIGCFADEQVQPGGVPVRFYIAVVIRVIGNSVSLDVADRLFSRIVIFYVYRW